MFTMRFSQRSATEDPAARADLYAATIDMCAWAEDHGALAAILSQHHAVDDGYLPSPVPLASAIAAEDDARCPSPWRRCCWRSTSP